MSAGPVEEREVTLHDLLQVLVQHRLTVAICAGATLALALAVGILTTPVYRSTITLSVVSEGGEGGGALASLASEYGALAAAAGLNLGGGGDSGRDEAIATLKSRRLVEQFIQDENLLPVLFAGKWDAAAGRWKVEGDEVPTLNDGYRVFDSEIRFVSEDEDGMLSFAIEWKDRELAQAWAHALVARANKMLRERALMEAERSLAYLNQEVAKTRVLEVQQSLYRLIESQLRAIMLANGREDYAFKVIDPAVAPDADEFVRPKRLLIAATGLIGGLFLGIFAAFVRSATSAPVR